MAQDLQLELQGTTNFTFSVEGRVHMRPLEFFWKTAANPPQLTAYRETLEVEGARILGADLDATMAAFLAFRDRLSTRTAFPTYARLRRLTGTGAPATEYVLGSNSADAGFAAYQGFMVELVETADDPLLKGGMWRRSVPINLRISAVRVFPDTNGIVGWEQTVTNRYPRGLHELEWRTTITTAEGTDARTKAALYAKIPIATYGTTYLWGAGGPNGPDGIEFEYDDADEQNARTPTRVVAVSRIHQVGIDVGSNDSGAAPEDVSFSEEVTLEGQQKTTVTRARAVGPNAMAFVTSKRPSGDLVRERTVEEFAEYEAEGEWTKIENAAAGGSSDADAELIRWAIGVEITGGAQDVEFVPQSSPYPPAIVVGPIQPWTVTVEVTMKTVQADAKRGDMPFPALLPAPFVFIPNESTADEVPRLTKPGKRVSQNEWERTARLTYKANKRPAATAFDGLYTKPSVLSYHLA